MSNTHGATYPLPTKTIGKKAIAAIWKLIPSATCIKHFELGIYKITGANGEILGHANLGNRHRNANIYVKH